MKAFIWIGHCKGGHELRDLEFAKYVRSRGVDVTLGVFEEDKSLDFRQQVFKPIFPKRLQGFNNLYIAYRIPKRFLNEFDFVFGRFARRTKAVKIFRVAGDLDDTWIPSIMSRAVYRFLKLCEERFFRRYDLVFAGSTAARLYLSRKGIRYERSSNFVDVNVFNIKRHEKVIDVLFVGRDDQIKNFGALKVACDELGVRLTTVGVDRWVSQDKLVHYYNAAKLVVLPSFYESFGNVVVESLACATPVLCSDKVTAAHELCSFVEICGTDKESIKRKLLEINDDYCASVRKALDGYCFVRQNLSSEKILADEFLRIVCLLIPGNIFV